MDILKAPDNKNCKVNNFLLWAYYISNFSDLESGFCSTSPLLVETSIDLTQNLLLTKVYSSSLLMDTFASHHNASHVILMFILLRYSNVDFYLSL